MSQLDLTNTYLKGAVVWIGLFGLAFVNGALREIGMKKLFGIGATQANRLSCATGILVWTSFTAILWRWLNISSWRDAAIVGAGWMLATLLVETFVLDRKLSWREVGHTYNFAAGEFWGLVVLWLGIVPLVLFGVLH